MNAACRPGSGHLDSDEDCDLVGMRPGGTASWQPVAVAIELLERIVVDADVSEGWATEAVLVEFPALEAEDVRACLAYAAQLADTRFAGSTSADPPGSERWR